MKRLVLLALACLAAAGCKKKQEEPVQSSTPQGGAGAGVFAPLGAAKRIVQANDLHQLHLFMTNAKGALGRVPTSQETWTELNRPDGSRELVKLIQDGSLILVPNPPEEGLWAYVKEAPTQGGWVLTHSEPRRVTAQEFAELAKQ
jgi:hypothetical protein